MSNRKLIAISALAITAAIPTLASAADFAAAPCLLGEHRVTSVTLSLARTRSARWT